MAKIRPNFFARAGRRITNLGRSAEDVGAPRMVSDTVNEIGKDLSSTADVDLNPFVSATVEFHRKLDEGKKRKANPDAVMELAGKDAARQVGVDPLTAAEFNEKFGKDFFGASSDFTMIDTGIMTGIVKHASPIIYNMASPDPEVRAWSSKLFMNHLPMRGNKDVDSGFATPVSVEQRINQKARNGRSVMAEIDSAFKNSGNLSRQEFLDELVTRRLMLQAGKKVNMDGFEEANKSIDGFFDRMLSEGQEAKMFSDDMPSGTYLPIYRNREKIMSDPEGFKEKWTAMLEDAGLEFREEQFELMVRSAINAERPIMNIDSFIRSNFKKTIRTKGGARLDYNFIKDYIETNPYTIIEKYARNTGADIEIARIADGDPTGGRIVKSLSMHAADKIASEPDTKKRLALQKHYARAIGNVKYGIEVLRQVNNVAYRPDSAYNNILPTLKHYSYAARSGFFPLSNLDDFLRGSTLHGLKPYAQQLGEIVFGGLGAIRARRAEALQFMEALDSMNLSVQTKMIDLSNHASHSRLLGGARELANFTHTATGMKAWIDFSQSFNVISAGSEIMEAAVKGGYRAQHSSLGITKGNMKLFAEQYQKYGSKTRTGRMVPNIEKWDSPAAVESFRLAVNKSLDFATGMPNAISIPKMASTRLGSTLFQFWGFMMGNVSKQSWSVMSYHDRYALMSVAAALSIGAVKVYLKNEFRSRPNNDPYDLLTGAVDESGLLAALPGMSMMGLTLVKSQYPDFEVNFGRYVSNDPRDLLGPAFGLVFQAYDSAPHVVASLANGEMPERPEFNRLYGLLPVTGIFYIRYLLSQLGVDARSPAYDRQSYREDPTGQDVNRIWDFPSQHPNFDRLSRQTNVASRPDDRRAVGPHDGGDGLGMGGLQPMGDDRSTLGPR